MDIMELGAIGELVGGVAVLATLAYLAIQIRQNTKSNQHLATQNLLGLQVNANLMIADNGELAGILQRNMAADRQDLRPEEQLRFNTFFLGAYSQFDFAYSQYRAGQLDEGVWKRIEYEISLFLGLPGVAAWWDQDKPRFSEEFVRYADEKIAVFVPPAVIPTIGRPSHLE